MLQGAKTGALAMQSMHGPRHSPEAAAAGANSSSSSSRSGAIAPAAEVMQATEVVQQPEGAALAAE